MVSEQFRLIVEIVVILIVTFIVIYLIGRWIENSRWYNEYRESYNAMASRVTGKKPKSKPRPVEVVKYRSPVRKTRKMPEVCMYCGNFLKGARKVCPHCGAEIERE